MEDSTLEDKQRFLPFSQGLQEWGRGGGGGGCEGGGGGAERQYLCIPVYFP